MDDEERAELIEKSEKYRSIDEMVKTTGWQNIVIPRIDQLKEQNMQKLLNATEHRDIMRAQETLKSIDDILCGLMMDMKEGEEAMEILAKEKDK